VITPKYKILRQEAKQTFSLRKAQAQMRLIRTVKEAAVHVPYYRDLFQKIGFDPESLDRDIRYFEDIPYLTKQELRTEGLRLIDERYKDKIVREQKTGGSTGPAAIVRYDQESIDWTAAQNILMLEWGGKHRWDREAHLSTRFPGMEKQLLHEGDKEKVLNRYNIYTAGFDAESQKNLIADIKNSNAKFIQGHPSSLYALARYVQSHNIKLESFFSVFVSTGELLSDKQRALIEEILRVRVSNRYGSCEFGVMAQELADGPKGYLKVHDSMVWPEVFQPDTESKQGELVFTALRNPSMPLIRYRIGDLGRLEENENGWWISALCGRTHNSVIINDSSYPTHYIQDILDRCGPIEEFQIFAPEGKALEMRLVVEEEHWDEVCAKVQRNFPELAVRRISSKELVFAGSRGKFSYIVRE
jgi:phenylacetate-CoA ligase